METFKNSIYVTWTVTVPFKCNAVIEVFFFLSFFHLTEFREDSLKKENHSVQQYE